MNRKGGQYGRRRGAAAFLFNQRHQEIERSLGGGVAVEFTGASMPDLIEEICARSLWARGKPARILSRLKSVIAEHAKMMAEAGRFQAARAARTLL